MKRLRSRSIIFVILGIGSCFRLALLVWDYYAIGRLVPHK